MSTTRNAIRRKKSFRIRKKLSGTAARPRLTVYRGLTNLYAQIIDDTSGNTIASSSTIDKELKAKEKGLASNAASAKIVGKSVAERAIKKGIKQVVFDRNGYQYAGVLKELADAARAAGLEF